MDKYTSRRFDIQSEEAIDPGYWVKQLRNMVRFEEGIKELLKNDDVIFIEMGFKVLSSLIKQHKNYTDQCMVNMLRNPKEKTDDQFHFLQSIGTLWSRGLNINWIEYFNDEKRQRIPLPTYPFERERFWLDGDSPLGNLSALGKSEQLDQKKQNIDDWFYLPTWKRIPARLISILQNGLSQIRFGAPLSSAKRLDGLAQLTNRPLALCECLGIVTFRVGRYANINGT